MDAWLTPQQVADLRLPGVPRTDRGVRKWAQKNLVTTRTRVRGKGIEIAVSSLPLEAQRAVYARLGETVTDGSGAGCTLSRAQSSGRRDGTNKAGDGPSDGKGQLTLGAGSSPAAPTPAAAEEAPGVLSAFAREQWEWFSRRPESIQAEGRRRAEWARAIRQRVDLGETARAAIAAVSQETGVPVGTLRRIWWGDERHVGAAYVTPDVYAPVLAPRYAGREAVAEMSPEAWEALKADWLRPEQPSLLAVYRRVLRMAGERGWTIPSYATVRRMVQKLPWTMVVYAREGREALERRLPRVSRTRGHLQAMEAVCADGHTLDVRVVLPSGEVGRPVLVAWQDIYSGKILAWRVGETLSGHLVRLSFGDLVEAYGVPKHVYLDNGREFANKWMTGGAPRRFRFRVREEDPEGIFRLMGVEVHFTTPYHGQSKPIERAFRDLCESIARHPAAAGCYTGSSPTAKPANYGERALSWEECLRLVDAGIREHNSREGRRTETARGRSFDATFAESYAQAVVRRPTEEQRRLWLLAAEGVKVRQDGHVHILGNFYWSEMLPALAGHRVVVRFDPERLDAPVHIYRMDGSYVGEAQRLVAGFDDAAAAREVARLRRQALRAAAAQLKAQRRLQALEVAAMLPPPPQAAEAVPAAVQVMGSRRRRAPQTPPEVLELERRVLDMLPAWAEARRQNVG